MACESGLACLSASGCVEPLANGAVGTIMTVGADGTPQWAASDDLEDLGFHPAAAAQGTTTTVLPANTYTAIPTPNAVHQSVAGMVSGGNLVAPESGYYNISGYVDAVGVAGDRFGVRLVHGSFDVRELHASEISFSGATRTRLSFNEPGVFLFAGDTVSLEGFTNASQVIPGDQVTIRRARVAMVQVDQQ